MAGFRIYSFYLVWHVASKSYEDKPLLTRPPKKWRNRCHTRKIIQPQKNFTFQFNPQSAFFQGGLSEAQNGYGFGMIPGHGPHDVNLSSLALDGSPTCKLFTAPELERLTSWGPCAMGRGLNPTFHSQMSTPGQPLQQITWFLVFWCSCNE